MQFINLTYSGYSIYSVYVRYFMYSSFRSKSVVLRGTFLYRGCHGVLTIVPRLSNLKIDRKDLKNNILTSVVLALITACLDTLVDVSYLPFACEELE